MLQVINTNSPEGQAAHAGIGHLPMSDCIRHTNADGRGEDHVIGLRRCRLYAAMVWLLALSCTTDSFGQSLEDQQFADTLVAGGYLGLAQQFCETRIAETRDAEKLATWHLQLSRCLQQQAWRQQGKNRQQLISHAISRITELFSATTQLPAAELPAAPLPENQPPENQLPAPLPVRQSFSARADLLLRLRQLELLIDANRMELIVQQAGDWYQPPGIQMQFANIAPAQPVAEEDFYRKGLQSVTESCDALMTQLDQIRRDMDSQDARLIRDRLRLMAAEAAFLTELWRSVGHFATTADADGNPRFQESASRALALTRSSNDSDIRSSASLLAVQIALHQNDWTTFELRGDSLQHQSPGPVISGRLFQQQVLALLQQGRPADALEMLNTQLDDRPVDIQIRRWLRCESLLGMFAVLHSLGNDAVAARTAEELRIHLRQARSSTVGVWRECVEQVEQRFHRVEQVGSELADVLNGVDQLAASGNTQQARLMLTQVMKSLPNSTRVRVRASLNLRAGELAVQAGKWEIAVQDLQPAVEGFRSVNDSSSAAAADILKAFALGQRWAAMSRSPNGSPTVAASRPDSSRDEYLDALTQHLALYSDQPSARMAREWLIQLLRPSEPVAAAVHLLVLAASEDAASLKNLIDAGDLLLSEAVENEPGHLPADILEAFRQQSATALSPSDAMPTDLPSMDAGSVDGASVNKKSTETAQTDVHVDVPVPGDGRQRQRLNVLQFQLLLLTLLYPPEESDPTANSLPRPTWQAIDSQLLAMTADLQDAESELSRFAAIRQMAAARARLDTAQVTDIVSSMETFDRQQRVEVILWLQRLHRAERQGAIRLFEPQDTDGSSDADSEIAESTIPASLPGDALLGRAVLQMVSGILAETVAPAKSPARSAQSSGLNGAQKVPMTLRLLPAVVTATAATADNQLLDRMLETVLQGELTETQWTQLAQALQPTDQMAVIPEKNVPPTSAISPPSILRNAWSQILARSPQGTDRWLEASWQTARLHAAAGETDQALRIIAVVDVLYPNWGHPDRRQAARALRQQLGTP